MSMTEQSLRTATINGPCGTHQKRLNLSLSARTVLVTTDAVRAALGVDADTIAAKVDAGELRWVWNVALGREIAELRFWAREIVAPEFVADYTPAKVVAEILGIRSRWRGVELAQLLLVSRPTIMRLVDAGELKGEIVNGAIHVWRAPLEKFLLARLWKN